MQLAFTIKALPLSIEHGQLGLSLRMLLLFLVCHLCMLHLRAINYNRVMLNVQQLAKGKKIGGHATVNSSLQPFKTQVEVSC